MLGCGRACSFAPFHSFSPRPSPPRPALPSLTVPSQPLAWPCQRDLAPLLPALLFFFLVCDGIDAHVPRLDSRCCPCHPCDRVCRQRLSSKKPLRQGAAKGSTSEVQPCTQRHVSKSKMNVGGACVHGGCSACTFGRFPLGRALWEKRLWESEVQQGVCALRGAPEPLGSGLSRPAQTPSGAVCAFLADLGFLGSKHGRTSPSPQLGDIIQSPAQRCPLQGAISGASQPTPTSTQHHPQR